MNGLCLTSVATVLIANVVLLADPLATDSVAASGQTVQVNSLHADGYHSHAALTDLLLLYSEAHPDICRLRTLGKSVEGREMWAMFISTNPDEEEDEPEFACISAIHGSEPEGMEISLYLIDLLLKQYHREKRIADLVDNTAIWIVPLLNPDGLAAGTRENANGIDLNADFPSPENLSQNLFEGGPLDAEGRQPEVQHIMNWMAANSLVLSANLHAGELLVCYPYCWTEEVTPDEALFHQIAKQYAVHNPPMWESPTYRNGVVNGAEWFVRAGTTIDWCYSYLSCNTVTVELVEGQTVMPASEIRALWSDNAESLISFMETVHMGVRGTVIDRQTGEPLWAEAFVYGNSHPVLTDPDVGDYHRMLLPGTYDLVFFAYGYRPFIARDVVVTDGPATRLDIALYPRKSPR